MDSRDFLRLQGLLAKLNNAANKAASTDGSFEKYHKQSISLLRDLPKCLQQLEQGLKTAKMMK